MVGVPDELRGEVVEAFVALRPGIQASDELVEALKEHVKTGFAAHAYPRAVHFVDALPRTPSGKVQRFVLRNRRRDELAALQGDTATPSESAASELGRAVLVEDVELGDGEARGASAGPRSAA